MGDLVATCSSPLSRNRRFGEYLGQGMNAAQATEMTAQTAEGVTSYAPVLELARKYGVEDADHGGGRRGDHRTAAGGGCRNCPDVTLGQARMVRIGVTPWMCGWAGAYPWVSAKASPFPGGRLDCWELLGAVHVEIARRQLGENTRAVHLPPPPRRPSGRSARRSTAQRPGRSPPRRSTRPCSTTRCLATSSRRIDNPTVDAFARAVAALEGADLGRWPAAQAFSSGMAAISGVFLAFARAGGAPWWPPPPSTAAPTACCATC